MFILICYVSLIIISIGVNVYGYLVTRKDRIPRTWILNVGPLFEVWGLGGLVYCVCENYFSNYFNIYKISINNDVFLLIGSFGSAISIMGNFSPRFTFSKFWYKSSNTYYFILFLGYTYFGYSDKF